MTLIVAKFDENLSTKANKSVLEHMKKEFEQNYFSKDNIFTFEQRFITHESAVSTLEQISKVQLDEAIKEIKKLSEDFSTKYITAQLTKFR